MKKNKRIEYIIKASQLPKEIITNEPKITLIGESEIMIENHNGLIMYDESNVKINTVYYPLSIKGNNLTIKRMDNEVIIINGNIKSFEYLKMGDA